MSTENEALQIGVVPLRPLQLTDIVNGAVQAVRRNAAALVGISAIVAVVGQLAIAGISVLALGRVRIEPPTVLASTTIEDLRPFFVASLITGAVLGLLGLLSTAVINVVVPRAVFGHSMGLAQAAKSAAPTLLRLFGVVLVVTAMITVLVAVGIGAILALGGVGVLVLIVVLVPVVYLAVALSFTSSVVVVEGLGPIAALERSRTLVHAAGWWRVLGILLLSGVAIGAMTGAITAVFELVSGGSVVGEMLATVLTSAVFVPVVGAIQTLLYVDHRCRYEGVEGLWREAG